MQSSKRGAVGLVVGVVAVVLLYAMMHLLGDIARHLSYHHGPKDTTSRVHSPDEAHTAYVEQRWLGLDTAVLHLYIQKEGHLPQAIHQVSGTDVKWSPDSHRIAVADNPRSDTLWLFVYDLSTQAFGEGFFSVSLKLAPSSCPGIEWKWRDSETVEFVIVGQSGKLLAGPVLVDIMDTADGLKLSQRTTDAELVPRLPQNEKGP